MRFPQEKYCQPTSILLLLLLQNYVSREKGFRMPHCGSDFSHFMFPTFSLSLSSYRVKGVCVWALSWPIFNITTQTSNPPIIVFSVKILLHSIPLPFFTSFIYFYIYYIPFLLHSSHHFLIIFISFLISLLFKSFLSFH